jgi:hypothetical protein
MKRIISFVVTAFVLATGAYAQESHLFIRAGVNRANVTISDDGKYSDANALWTFHAGLTADLPLSKFVSVQPSLLFTGKGAKTAYGQSSGAFPTYFKATTNPYYVELPVNVLGKIPLAMDESSFFIGAGPYIAVGVGGKNKSEGQVIGVRFESEDRIDFSDDDPTTTNYEEQAGLTRLKRFDYGLNATAGFQLNNLMLSVNYGYGLAKLASGANNGHNNNDENNKHRVISFSVGVRL